MNRISKEAAFCKYDFLKKLKWEQAGIDYLDFLLDKEKISPDDCVKILEMSEY